jgi:S-DNA-T family DNA segregation ATPase FtsK/SpoIIIE
MAGTSKSTKTSLGGKTGLREMWGILCLVFLLLLSLSLLSYDWKDLSLFKTPPNDPPQNLIGWVGAWGSFLFIYLLGIGAFSVPIVLLGLGMLLLLSRDTPIASKILWGMLFSFSIAGLFQVDYDRWAYLCSDEKLHLDIFAGGQLGYLVVQEILVKFLNPLGARVLCWSGVILAVFMFIGPRNILSAGQWCLAAIVGVTASVKDRALERQDRREQIEHEKRELEKQRQRLEKAMEKTRKKAKDAEALIDEGELPEEMIKPKPRAVIEPEPEPYIPEPEPEPEPPPPPPPPPPQKKAPVQESSSEDQELVELGANASASNKAYTIPRVTLLDEVVAQDHSGGIDLDKVAATLQASLSEFGIEAEVTNVERGPVVTQFEVLPAAGVRVERISSLANNIALALKATSIRVQAPIPGKGVVGIEVPNGGKPVVVSTRAIMESDAYKHSKHALPLVLGQDVTGNNLVVDLAKMPHLLIAGATGAGKSVCMNSVLMGLLMKLPPEKLRLMLVDPKIVEFSIYKDIPHLVVPVITDPKKVALGLRWAIKEMEKRYKMFAEVGVRNIEGFNTRPKAEQQDLFDDDEDVDEEESAKEALPETVPYIVIIIDELADLMLVAQAEIENCIARLAQLSRATGIHMIIATQRPSVNVITGTIKANFPARIAFQVAQKVDSRTILDTVGAEQLLGKGDLLYMPPGGTKTVRAQGSLTTDDEVRRVVEFIKEQEIAPKFVAEVKDKIESKSVSVDSGEDDEMLEQAIEVIRETQRASTSSLQRRLRIGYTRAARMMDILEERGLIGPPRGSDPREILIDLDGNIPDNDSSPTEE